MTSSRRVTRSRWHFDASEGISKARDFHPDVVVCDLAVPGVGGFAVARTIRADEALKNACLVAISGYAQPQDIQQASEAGFTYYFCKPFSPSHFSYF